MYLMGYRVGTASSLKATERRRILETIFSADTLDFEGHDDAYVERWGAANSAERLQRIVRQIMFSMNLASGKGWSDMQCLKDWASDLAWLKRTYYRKAVHGFKWPVNKSTKA